MFRGSSLPVIHFRNTMFFEIIYQKGALASETARYDTVGNTILIHCTILYQSIVQNSTLLTARRVGCFDLISTEDDV